jgi:hypothetical protein
MDKIKWIIVEDIKELMLLTELGIQIPSYSNFKSEDFYLGISIDKPLRYLGIDEIQGDNDGIHRKEYEYEFLCNIVLNEEPCQEIFGKSSNFCKELYNKL